MSVYFTTTKYRQDSECYNRSNRRALEGDSGMPKRQCFKYEIIWLIDWLIDWLIEKRAKTVIQTATETIRNGDKRKRTWSVDTNEAYGYLCCLCAWWCVFQTRNNLNAYLITWWSDWSLASCRGFFRRLRGMDAYYGRTADCWTGGVSVPRSRRLWGGCTGSTNDTT